MKAITLVTALLFLALTANGQSLYLKPAPSGLHWPAQYARSGRNLILPTREATQADLVTSAKAFIDLLTAKDFARAETYFDETMKSVVPEDKLTNAWNSVLAEAGAFKRQAGAKTDKNGLYDIVRVTVEFEREKLIVRLVFDSMKRIAGLFFDPFAPEYTAPGYVNPTVFREQEVTVGAGEWALPGTLTVPNGKGPFPAVVLVHGSGPNDRDETIGPNKPFSDLAGALASKGIAVLRYEKRTRQYAAKLSSANQLTVKEEVVDDVLAAIALLRQNPAIDKKKIFVLGHSLGGMLIPRIGKLDPGIAGLIVMAGATRPLEDVIPEQLSYIFSLDGTISKEEQAQLDDARGQAAKVKALTSTDVKTWAFGVPASYWLDLRGYDPPETAKALKQPMLILQGERDFQVTMQDLGRWQSALGQKRNVAFKSYPKLNHLFVEGNEKSVPAEYNRLGHIGDAVLVDIAAWIHKIRP